MSYNKAWGVCCDSVYRQGKHRIRTLTQCVGDPEGFQEKWPLACHGKHALELEGKNEEEQQNMRT